MRAVAVGSVMAFHYNALPFAYGRFGVSLFFVLSGFLITLLLVRERERTSTVSLKKFYARRALRIFPAYYAFLVLSFGAMLLLGTRPDLALVGASVLYVLNYAIALGEVPPSIVSHGWSLAVEEQFYAIWPVTILALGADHRRIKLVVLGLLVLIALWRVVLIARGVNGYVYYAFDTRFDALLMGCGLALCAKDDWLQSVARWVSRHPLLPVVTVAVLHYSLGDFGFWNETFGYTVEALLLATLLVQVMVLHVRRPWNWLNTRPLWYLGMLSYPLYLYHQLVASLVSRYGAWRWSVQVIANVVLTVALAASSYHLLERPFLRMKRRWQVVGTDR
jgi:peptidoglycan/LPS O-acetylase OafA/YrhL